MAHRCPICHVEVPTAPRPESFPFCTSRCKLVDLGNWLDSAYRIPAQEETLYSEEVDGGAGSDSPGEDEG